MISVDALRSKVQFKFQNPKPKPVTYQAGQQSVSQPKPENLRPVPNSSKELALTKILPSLSLSLRFLQRNLQHWMIQEIGGAPKIAKLFVLLKNLSSPLCMCRRKDPSFIFACTLASNAQFLVHFSPLGVVGCCLLQHLVDSWGWWFGLGAFWW